MTTATPGLQIVIGGEGELARFRVRGPRCPDATEAWYRAQLDVVLEIVTTAGVSQRKMTMFSDDFHLFERRLAERERTEAGIWIDTGDFFSLTFLDDDAHGFHAWIQLDALTRGDELVAKDGGSDNWEWRIRVDRESLPTILDEVRRITAQYPVRSANPADR